jgi:hypothetical protein
VAGANFASARRQLDEVQAAQGSQLFDAWGFLQDARKGYHLLASLQAVSQAVSVLQQHPDPAMRPAAGGAAALEWAASVLLAPALNTYLFGWFAFECCKQHMEQEQHMQEEEQQQEEQPSAQQQLGELELQSVGMFSTDALLLLTCCFVESSGSAAAPQAVQKAFYAAAQKAGVEGLTMQQVEGLHTLVQGMLGEDFGPRYTSFLLQLGMAQPAAADQPGALRGQQTAGGDLSVPSDSSSGTAISTAAAVAAVAAAAHPQPSAAAARQHHSPVPWEITPENLAQQAAWEQKNGPLPELSSDTLCWVCYADDEILQKKAFDLLCLSPASPEPPNGPTLAPTATAAAAGSMGGALVIDVAGATAAALTGLSIADAAYDAALAQADGLVAAAAAHAKQAEMQCYAAGGKAAALTVLQQLSGSSNALDRPDAVEAGLLRWVGSELQCPDVVSLYLGWHMYLRCKPRMHELRLGHIAEFGFYADDDDAIFSESQIGEQSTSSVPETESDDSKPPMLLLVCCWSASKVAGYYDDAAKIADVAWALGIYEVGVANIERQVLEVLEQDVMRGFHAFLQGLKLQAPYWKL